MTQKKNVSLQHVMLWVLQVAVAAVMLMAAFMKLAEPISRLAASYPWMGQASPLFVRFMGAVDLLGALGLLLPGILRIRPALTAWTAAAIVLLMICAIIFHVSRGEGAVTGFNIAVALMAAVIAWGRFRTTPATRPAG
ncbi:DoxX family protein [Chitinophaga sp. Mgbs1]|uniref:DoxX family protein n=1 Tax=Chitinophaga solisilvae TaxID=1233460 RepID=A0A433WCE4_9BACT|nr:DoxX family protein [Chitinophaga solisilvae]